MGHTLQWLSLLVRSSDIDGTRLEQLGSSWSVNVLCGAVSAFALFHGGMQGMLCDGEWKSERRRGTRGWLVVMPCDVMVRRSRYGGRVVVVSEYGCWVTRYMFHG